MRVNFSIVLVVVLFLLLGVIIGQNWVNVDHSGETDNEEVIEISRTTATGIQRDPEETNALDRYYNPLRYPYKTYPVYYNPFQLPNQVIGCGSRRAPCVGVGSSIQPITNALPGIEIGEGNIAPINIHTRGPLGMPQQVGVIYKIKGDENSVYPLMGRKKYPNGDKWEYYTLMGVDGRMKVPIPPKRNDQELGTNDVIRLQGVPGLYRVTVYDSDFPQYIPYA